MEIEMELKLELERERERERELEFRKLILSPRTPEGFRLATLAQVKKNYQKLSREGILRVSETVRLLDGLSRDGNYIPLEKVLWRSIKVTHMLVFGKYPMVVSRGSGLLRKDLYSRIGSLEDKTIDDALHLSCITGDIEVLYWLLQTAHQSKLDRIRVELMSGELSPCSPDRSRFMKMLLVERVDIEEDEVKAALDYALANNEIKDDAVAADYAIAIAELVLEKCSNKRKVGIVESQIERVAKSIVVDRMADAKHMGMLAKLLSESKHPLENRVDVIKAEYGKLLKEAVRGGYVSLVEELLRLPDTVKGDLPRDVDGDGKSLLHNAAEWKKSENADAVSQLLVETYVDSLGIEFVKSLDINRSVLGLAAFSGRVKFCKKIIDKYKFEEVKDFREHRNKKGETPLHQAAICGDIEMVSRMQTYSWLEENVNHRDFDGRYPLHMAAREGHLEIVTKLLEAGCDPLKARDNSGRTAIHYAVTHPKSTDARKVVDALLNHYTSQPERKALLLWASAAGLGTADQTKLLDPNLKKYLRKQKKELGKKVHLLRAAAIEKDSRSTWELLNRGGDIAELNKDGENKLSWVNEKMGKISEQETDQASLKDTLGRDVLAQCITGHFLNTYITSAITVCISGGSGMGKSSLMKQIQAYLLTTAATLAFPNLWHYDDFKGAKRTKLSTKGHKMRQKVEKGIAELMKGKKNISLKYFLKDYLPEHEEVYKSLAFMDFNQLLKTKEKESVEQEQSWGDVPRVLTVNFNAGKYRGRDEAWAGLAVEITKEIEGSMTRAQWLSTCWRNAWRKNKDDFYIKFLFPGVLLTFLAVLIGCVERTLLDKINITDAILNKSLQYGTIPATVIAIVWAVLSQVVKLFQTVSDQMKGSFNIPDHSGKLGYQEQVISDIKFLKKEIGKKPFRVFSFVSGERWENWWGLWKDNIGETPVPKYGSAPEDKLRIIAFVDDLDHCEEAAMLQVLWAINLIFRDCKINVILALDKSTIRNALVNTPQFEQDKDYVDKYISKTIQLPVSLADPADDEWEKFLQHQLGQVPDDKETETNEEPVTKEVEDNSPFLQEPKARQDIECGRRMYTHCFLQEEEEERETEGEESGKLGETKWEGCLSFLYKWREEILYCLHYILNFFYSIVCNIKDETLRCQPRDHPTIEDYEDFSWLAREMLMLEYSEEEIKTFEDLKNLFTSMPKVPREWKCYLIYYKFARNVVFLRTIKGRTCPVHEWAVELMVWTFVCWQWKHEMNTLLQGWHKYLNEDKQTESSLKQVVSDYIHQAYSGEENCEEEENKEFIHILKELNTFRATKGLQALPVPTSKIKKKEEKERWNLLLQVLSEVHDVSGEGIRCFQEFRFHCDDKHISSRRKPRDPPLLHRT